VVGQCISKTKSNLGVALGVGLGVPLGILALLGLGGLAWYYLFRPEITMVPMTFLQTPVSRHSFPAFSSCLFDYYHKSFTIWYNIYSSTSCSEASSISRCAGSPNHKQSFHNILWKWAICRYSTASSSDSCKNFSLGTTQNNCEYGG
jgi:hypothetical protein